jgi:RimJ/RimL family protein N-acetyltransferase
MAPDLESARLFYTPLSLSHLSQSYVNWLNDPVVCKYLETGGNYTFEKLRAFLADVEKKEILFWAIHKKQDSKHIGNIKIDPVDTKNGLGEYGIMMGDRSEWGCGYAWEASTTIIQYCFETLNIRKMNLGVVEENFAAVNLYKKLGFIQEGTYKYHFFDGLRYLNSLRMSLFNGNYSYT